MKKFLTAIAMAGFAISPALASNLEDHCIAVTNESGGDPSGCSCLAESADSSMTDELMSVETEADIETLSDASKAAISACWPDA